jgi:hypothetical protein
VTLPPELSGTIPRDVRLTGGGIAVVVVAIALAVGALVSVVLLSVAQQRAGERGQVRERESINVPAALVIAVGPNRGERRFRDVTYRYEANGRAYQGRLVLRSRDRGTIKIGDTIPITYLESTPEVSWAKGHEPGSGPPLWVIPLVSISLLLGAAAVGRSVRRQWVLLSEGRVAQARISGHKKIHSHKHKAYSVSYEFQTLSGATCSARCEMGKTPPPVGAMVLVVYHRDKARWSAVYPLPFVRPGRR